MHLLKYADPQKQIQTEEEKEEAQKYEIFQKIEPSRKRKEDNGKLEKQKNQCQKFQFMLYLFNVIFKCLLVVCSFINTMLWQNLLNHNISPIQKDVKHFLFTDDEEEPDQYVYRLQIPPQMLQILIQDPHSEQREKSISAFLSLLSTDSN